MKALLSAALMLASLSSYAYDYTKTGEDQKTNGCNYMEPCKCTIEYDFNTSEQSVQMKATLQLPDEEKIIISNTTLSKNEPSYMLTEGELEDGTKVGVRFDFIGPTGLNQVTITETESEEDLINCKGLYRNPRRGGMGGLGL